MARIERRSGQSPAAGPPLRRPDDRATLPASSTRGKGRQRRRRTPLRRSSRSAAGARPRAPAALPRPPGGRRRALLRHPRPRPGAAALRPAVAGLGGRGARTLEAMAERYLAALRRIQPHGPYRLGGWSMGGVAAFEMARRLAQAGEEVELLALLDSYAPGHPGGVGREPARRSGRARPLRPRPRGPPRTAAAGRRRRPRGAGARDSAGRGLAAAQAAGLLPAELDFAETLRMLAVFRANLRRLQAYAGSPYPGRVTLFRAAGAGEPAGGAGALAGATLGWEAFAAAVERRARGGRSLQPGATAGGRGPGRPAERALGAALAAPDRTRRIAGPRRHGHGPPPAARPAANPPRNRGPPLAPKSARVTRCAGRSGCLRGWRARPAGRWPPAPPPPAAGRCRRGSRGRCRRCRRAPPGDSG